MEVATRERMVVVMRTTPHNTFRRRFLLRSPGSAAVCSSFGGSLPSNCGLIGSIPRAWRLELNEVLRPDCGLRRITVTYAYILCVRPPSASRGSFLVRRAALPARGFLRGRLD